MPRTTLILLLAVLLASPFAPALGQEQAASVDVPDKASLPATIPELIELMAEDDFAGMRASSRLMQIGKAAVPDLVKATGHSVARVRYWSVAALSGIGDERAVAAIRTCLRDEDAMVRAVAVWHLGRWLNQAEVCDSVLAALQDDSAFVRGWALKRLQASRCLAAAERIRDLLKAKEPEVRYDALHALTVLQGDRILPTLRETVRKDGSPLVREGAVRCCTVVEPRTPRTADVMILALSDADENVRRCAVGLLRKGFGQYFGFDPAAEEKLRHIAAGRWREWYEANKAGLRWREDTRRFEVPEAGAKAAPPPGQSPVGAPPDAADEPAG